MSGSPHASGGRLAGGAFTPHHMTYGWWLTEYRGLRGVIARRTRERIAAQSAATKRYRHRLVSS